MLQWPLQTYIHLPGNHLVQCITSFLQILHPVPWMDLTGWQDRLPIALQITKRSILGPAPYMSAECLGRQYSRHVQALNYSMRAYERGGCGNNLLSRGCPPAPGHTAGDTITLMPSSWWSFPG